MTTKPLGFLLGAGAHSIPIPICEGVVTSLGRDDSNTVPLDDLGASRRHATVEGRDGAVLIMDLESGNGTFVDESKLKPNEKTRLASGQEVRIGGKVFFVVSADSPLEKQKTTLSRAGAFSRKSTLISVKSHKEGGSKERPQFVSQQTPVPASSSSQRKKKATGNIKPKPTPEPAQKAPSDPPGYKEEHTLSGAINAGGLPQIIQMIHSKHFSGSMKVTGNNLTSTILFVNGDMYAAFSGRERGMEAIYNCALATNTAFTFDRLEVSAIKITPRNITRGTMQILMDCCCKIHEASQRP